MKIKSTSELKPYHQRVCKGYGHLVGPTEMYCIATETITPKETVKATSRILNYVPTQKTDNSN